LRRHPNCVVCGAPATEVDHVVPIESGGTHHDSNLRSLCKRHHSAKTMRQSVARSHKG
jgi:5-methylcytosine-specific restriction protein A